MLQALGAIIFILSLIGVLLTPLVKVVCRGCNKLKPGSFYKIVKIVCVFVISMTVFLWFKDTGRYQPIVEKRYKHDGNINYETVYVIDTKTGKKV